ncbi:hypothetical protein DIE03_17895 [Burkholderia sp. Bp8992]|uniref:hypothetical protein n=1 Tax=unclassified Burkholderia TaxID=2613784 RepID=UPI000F579724|nr:MULTISPECIES: hypothetical protein [unclassified Burkholderia]RQS28948.1 hypothetical protein DIE03_17895 [Burkholderia sp. Bp8992]
MTPLQVVQHLAVLTNAIEVAVVRADWDEAVQAADARLRFVVALATESPDEVRAALRRMQEIDVRISTVARDKLQVHIAESRIALHETRAATNALKARQQLLGVGAAAPRRAFRTGARSDSRPATRS